MRWRPLRRAATAYVIAIGTVALLSGGLIGSTFALFTAETTNANSTFAGGWVDPPAGAAATLQGNSVKLTWTPGTNGVDTQQVLAADNGSNSDCSGASPASVYSTNSGTKATYTDQSTVTNADTTSWFCYQIQSSNQGWTAVSPPVPVQVGIFATSIAITSQTAGNAGTINQNDKIAIGFNQRPVNLTPLLVCVWTSGTIVLGDTTGACSADTDASYFGVLTVSGATIGANVSYETSTAGWSASTFLETVTLKTATRPLPTASVTGTPTWTYVPDAALLSNAGGTNQATVCSSAPTCQPTTASSF